MPGASGGAVGKDTALQAGRTRGKFPMVLRFSSTKFFRPPYDLGFESASRNIFWRVKVACDNLTTFV
jgi:hypothetical protein